jgi:hypothetical protein
MKEISRRAFLTSMGMAAGGATMGLGLPLLMGQVSRSPMALPRIPGFKRLADLALGEAKALGCGFAAVWIHRRREGFLSREERSSGNGSSLAETESERLTFDIRVVHSGGWGHAEGSIQMDEILEATARAVGMARSNAALANRPATILLPARKDYWVASHEPFDRPLDERLGSLVAAGNRLARTFAAEETFFVSSKGGLSLSSRLRVA